MWSGQINNDQFYRSQFESQIGEQNTNLCSEFDVNLTGQNVGIVVDNLQYFNTEPIIDSTPNAILSEQARNEDLFAPGIKEHPSSSFVNNIAESQCCGSRAAQTNYEQSKMNARVGGGTILTSMAPGFPYTNTPARMFNTTHSHSDVHAIKRKAEEDYSLFYAGAKRRIMDEHMAAEMNSLYIANDHNYCENAAIFNPDSSLEMQFSTISDDMIQNDGDADNHNDIDQGERRDYPVFHFTAPLEEILRKRDDLLPPKILEEISKPCLAMVPWTPPLHTDARITFKLQGKKTGVRKMPSKYEEMEDEDLVS